MIAENRILWLPGEERSWDDDGGRSPAGVRITPENATSVAAVFSCLRILAETVAGLPLHLLERTASGGKRLARELPLYRRLHSQPNNWQTSFEWREQAVMHVALWGDAFSELVPGASGAIDQIVPLHPSRMKVETLENGRLRYSYREAGGRQTVYSDEQILHMRGPSDDGVHGISIVEECREAIALARACEVHGARFFGAGARPGFVLSTENQLNAEARRELAENWNRKHRGPHNAHETAVLTGGLKPYEVPYASNSDSQYLELREHQLREIARLFRIPGYLLGLEQGSPQSEIQFVTHTIMPWLRRFESAFLRDLIVDDEKYLAEFDVRGLLRGDAASRSAYYRAMWDIGVVSTNDIRASENLDPVEGGDERYRPLNMGTLGAMPSVDDVLAQQQPGSGIDGQAVEGGVAAAEQGQQAETVAPSETSLTTAEVSSLLTVVKQITDGTLTVDAARAIIAAAFPVLSSARVETILKGVQSPEPEPVQAPAPPADTATAERSRLLESRALTISIDFDRTFAADPQLWGEFARKSVAEGNTVVMISRRPEEDRDTVTETLGEYAPAFSQVLLVGGDTLKADAAQAAGISVDVWVDDSPQTIKPAQRDCGTGAGGFKPGNKCGGGGGGGGSSGGGAQGSAAGSSAKSLLKGSGSGRGFLEKARIETAQAIDEVHSLPEGTKEVSLKKSAGESTVGSYSPSQGVIKVSDKGTHPLMTTAHEFGHHIDYHVFGNGSTPGTAGMGGKDKDLQDFLKVCQESKAFKQLEAVRKLDVASAPYGINEDVVKSLRGWGEKNRYGAYLQSPRELWARAYAQYIAEKSGSAAMKKELQAEIDTAIRPERPSVTVPWTRHWEADDFAPISSAIDKILQSRGLKK